MTYADSMTAKKRVTTDWIRFPDIKLDRSVRSKAMRQRIEEMEKRLHAIESAVDDRIPTMQEVKREIATFYGLSNADFSGKCQAYVISQPRQVAMLLCRTVAKRSLADIGYYMGGRDHSTVSHGIQRIEARMKIDRELADEVRYLRRCFA